ncbi:MAG: helix-turn-helix transcriptional regulator, partial [Actinobacteria bacterium]|nr:helix-turn-helix transcriptional regulator [Actinomycetota bacterium]
RSGKGMCAENSCGRRARQDCRGRLGASGTMRKRPVFMIGIAADLIGVHPQTLRMYEQKGLLRPRKSLKNTRLYSQEDVDLGRYIQKLTQEMGMNLAGVRKILDLESNIERLEAENASLREELERQSVEHGEAVEEVHRSYKREIVLLPRGELVRRRRQGS